MAAVVLLLVGCLVFTAVSIYRFVPDGEGVTADAVIVLGRRCGGMAYASPTPTTRYRSWRTQFSFLAWETFFYWVYSLPDS